LGEAAALRQAGSFRRCVEEVRLANSAPDDPMPEEVVWS
jgi:hypothetical protein